MAEANEFLAGVIEGFYGKPWSQEERFELFGWLKDWGLNTYFYAPKDDLKHRALWRELYSPEEELVLKDLIAGCRSRGLKFIYGIAPGLDIKYSEDWEITVLKVKLEQLQKLGCRDFAILFDDIPTELEPRDSEHFEDFASAQCHVVNTVSRSLLLAERFFFCPTPYCGRMATSKVGGENYLATVGKGLSANIGIFWTGPEIISREITVEHIQEVASLLRRKPLIWDNLHANDYDGHRFYVGPYSGRPPELLNEIAGILSNPNCEFPLNYVPIKTLADFISKDGKRPRDRYTAAVHEWWRGFSLTRSSLTPNELVLFTDCFYLPFEDGEKANLLLTKLRLELLQMKNGIPDGQRIPEIEKLGKICVRLSELKNRPLLYAMSRRIWELREELDLLARILKGDRKSDFHLPGTFRGGFVSELQKLLKQKADGSFET